MNAQQIQELIKALKAAEQTVIDLYWQPQDDPELKKALGELWDSCQDYCTVYENFSRQ